MLESETMSSDRFRTALVAEAARLGIVLPHDKLDALCVYYDLLRTWNAHIRLVGTVEPARAAVELFADALVACEFARSLVADRRGSRSRRPLALIDVGSGAGLPGIPAKIMRPEWLATLVDSNAKKVAFLKQLARTLDITDVRIVRGRAEAIAHDPAYRERFDMAFCRAVAAPAIACELALPFLACDGSLVLHMATPENDPDNKQALEEARAVAVKLGATLGVKRTYELSITSGIRMLLQVHKTAATPRDFPRDGNTMKKHPLA